MEHKRILQLTQCALIAALAYVGFQFLRIDIPVGTERTAIHLGNTFVVLGALLLGGWGGFAGALGLTMADLTSGYLTSAPKTFLLKLVIGLIVTLVSRKFFHIENEPGVKGQVKIALLSSAAALGVPGFDGVSATGLAAAGGTLSGFAADAGVGGALSGCAGF